MGSSVNEALVDVDAVSVTVGPDLVSVSSSEGDSLDVISELRETDDVGWDDSDLEAVISSEKDLDEDVDSDEVISSLRDSLCVAFCDLVIDNSSESECESVLEISCEFV